MPKTVQIRDIDDDVYAGLRRRAAAEGISVPELLRAEATRLASRPTIAEWVERKRGHTPRGTRSRIDSVALLDEHRGPWPDVDR